MDGEISSDFLVPNLVLKRKRSPRQRPFGVNGNSSSSEDDIVDGGVMAAATFSLSLEEDEEEHQAAKCLMLLAQGEYCVEFNSLRIGVKTEMKTSGGLYECKTCNRTFQSFQALGGHRTSHKKMKIATEELMPMKQVIKQTEKACNLLPPTALHLGTSRAAQKVRSHGCLICGAIFASGQALGGHMRRHRVTLAMSSSLEGEITTKTETKSDGITLSLLSPVQQEEFGNEISRSNNDFQYLDLNLPASSSEEDEIGDSQFCFGSKQATQQEESGLVFSSASLVDCHY